MENKQSSIEWLLQRFEDGDMYNLEDAQFIKHQALKIHKEEIVDAFGVGCQVESTRLIGYQGMAEQYYNETYERKTTESK